MSLSLTAPWFLLLSPVLLLPLLFLPPISKVQIRLFLGTVPLLLRSAQKNSSQNRFAKPFILLLRILLLASFILALSGPLGVVSATYVKSANKHSPLTVNMIVPDINNLTANYPSWALESNNQSDHPPRFATSTFPMTDLIRHLQDSNSIYFFCDIPTLTPEQADLLIHVWKIGKGLIISFAPNTNMDSWNTLFFARLFQSAQLRPLSNPIDSITPTFSTNQNNDFLHPILQPFQSQSSNIVFSDETPLSILPDPTISPILYNFNAQPLIYVSSPLPQSQKPLVLFLSPTLSGPFPLSPHFLPLLTESVLWVHQHTTTTVFSLSSILLTLALLLFLAERYCQNLWFSATLHKR